MRHWLTHLKTLGKGSFGTTYTADLTNKDKLLNQFVIKAIDDNVDSDGEYKNNNLNKDADGLHEFLLPRDC